MTAGMEDDELGRLLQGLAQIASRVYTINIYQEVRYGNCKTIRKW